MSDHSVTTKGLVLPEDVKLFKHAGIKLQGIETSEAKVDRTTGRNRRIHSLDGGRQHPSRGHR